MKSAPKENLQDFPNFNRPPVIETAIGVEFKPIDGWEVPHFGLFWAEVRSDYPSTQMVPALPSAIEKFGKEAEGAPAFSLEVIQGEPPVRAWFINESDGKLLQVQRDRFIHNWRKTSPEGSYPGYKTTRALFADGWRRFIDFLTTQKLGPPRVTQCEVTYVNHVERGLGWETLADLPKVTPLLTGRGSTGFLPNPEVFAVTARYLFPAQRGRLYVALQPAVRNADQKQILQLQLTARGKPETSSSDDVLDWIDLGHEWVVKGFADLTTKEMHQLWQKH